MPSKPPWLCLRVALLALALPLLALPARLGAQPVEPPLRIAFSGDTHGYHIVDDPALDGADLLAGVRGPLGKADLFVFNHEGTLIDGADVEAHCRTFTNQSTFATPPSFPDRLAPNVGAIANMANNHAMDCGPEGLSRTLAGFADAGIATVGAGADLADACRPLELTIKGVDLAFLSYLYQRPTTMPDGVAATATSPGVATMEACDAESAVRALAESAVVIVSLHAHYGSSWRYGASREQEHAVEGLLDWGAALVVSHGSHFPQGAIATGDGVALLGLGNFMFDPAYEMPLEAHRALFALLDIDAPGVTRARLYPTELTAQGLPVLARGAVFAETMAVVSELSAEYETSIAVAPDAFGLVRLASGRATQ